MEPRIQANPFPNDPDAFVASPIDEQLRRLKELFPGFNPAGVDETVAARESHARTASRYPNLVIMPSMAQLGDVYGADAPSKSTYGRAFQHLERLLRQTHPSVAARERNDKYHAGWDVQSYGKGRFLGENGYAYSKTATPDGLASVFGAFIGSYCRPHFYDRGVPAQKATVAFKRGSCAFDLDPIGLMVLMLTHPEWAPKGVSKEHRWPTAYSDNVTIACLGASHYPIFEFPYRLNGAGDPDDSLRIWMQREIDVAARGPSPARGVAWGIEMHS